MFAPATSAFTETVTKAKQAEQKRLAEEMEQKKSDEIERHRQLIKEVYGQQADIGALVHLFGEGNFINFGDWEGILLDESAQITQQQRTAASAALYQLVINKLKGHFSQHFTDQMQILDTGCGRGVGTQLLAKQVYPAKVFGLDVTNDQIQRAISFLPHESKITFQCKDIVEYKPGSTIDGIISVEAFQHFPDPQAAIESWYAMLKPGGVICIAAHFSVNQAAQTAMQGADQKLAMDILSPFDETIAQFRATGFEVEHQDITERVLPGYFRFFNQQKVQGKLSEEVINRTEKLQTSYNNKHLMYGVIVARKPSQPR